MRKDFELLMKKVEEGDIPFLTIEKDGEGNSFVVLSRKAIVNTHGKLFLLPANTEVVITDEGIGMQEPEMCKGCDSKCWTEPVGSLKEAQEYIDKRRKKRKKVKEEPEPEVDPKALDLTVFRKKGSA